LIIWRLVFIPFLRGTIWRQQTQSTLFLLQFLTCTTVCSSYHSVCNTLKYFHFWSTDINYNMLISLTKRTQKKVLPYQFLGFMFLPKPLGCHWNSRRFSIRSLTELKTEYNSHICNHAQFWSGERLPEGSVSRIYSCSVSTL
jgi:hypothetical protein